MATVDDGFRYDFDLLDLVVCTWCGCAVLKTLRTIHAVECSARKGAP